MTTPQFENSGAMIVWFRQDLRLADNPAIHFAADQGSAVIPVFIYAPEEESPWQPGAASRWWLHQSLHALDAQLRERGSKLIIRRGPSLDALRELIAETGATAVVWNRRYEPDVIKRDMAIKQGLTDDGMFTKSFNGALLHEPWTVQNKSGKPFQVFTPFWKHCLTKPDPSKPLPQPRNISAPGQWPKSLALTSLELEPKINWVGGLESNWEPGALGAARALKKFLSNAFDDYVEARNRPDVEGTSRLSPHLHFGEISPRQVWDGLRRMASKRSLAEETWRRSQFGTEIGWREFSHHLLFHFPQTPTKPLRKKFEGFPWRDEPEWLSAWQNGLTGYPIIDAGMRELWATGWMHNRVRMIVASFLVKDLLISWEAGAEWFWDTLVDADLAQNTLGWQWTAGCGADAAPYFRVFNPVSQGEKFDPNGDYVSTWCPELSNIPSNWIHQPHRAPFEVLRQASVVIGGNYPEPIVNHSTARELALEAFATIR